jgi:hypothetical protein
VFHATQITLTRVWYNRRDRAVVVRMTIAGTLQVRPGIILATQIILVCTWFAEYSISIARQNSLVGRSLYSREEVRTRDLSGAFKCRIVEAIGSLLVLVWFGVFCR